MSLHVSITADASKLEQAVDKANEKLQDIGTEAANSSGKLENAMEQAAQANDRVASSFEQTLSRVRAEFTEASKSPAEMAEALTESIATQVNVIGQLDGELKNIKEQISLYKEAGRDASGLEEHLKATANEAIAEREALAALTTVHDELSRKIEQAGQAMETASGSTRKSISDMLGLKEAGGAVDAAMASLPVPMQGATTSLKGLITAAKAFIATPIGAIIAALTAALKALTNWFSNSADGQRAFAKISGYVSGVLGVLGDVVRNVGEAMYKAFSNPQEAVKKLWETIKTNIVNRINGLGEMFKALGKIISSGFTEGYSDLGNAFLKVNTGVDDLAKKTKDFIGKVKGAGDEMSNLKTREIDLRLNKKAWEAEKATIQAEAAELYNSYYMSKDKAKLEQYKKLMGEIHKQDRKFAEEALSISKTKHSLSDSTIEDMEEELELQKQLNEVDAQYHQSLSRVSRQMGGLDRAGGREAGQAAKEAAQRREQLEELAEEGKRSAKDLAFEVEQARIDGMQDGFEKELAQTKLNHEKRLEELARQEAELLKQVQELAKANHEANGGKGNANIPTELSEESKGHFAALRDRANKEAEEAESKAREQALAEYLTYEEKLTEIKKRFAEERIMIEKAGGTEANQAELDRAEQEAIDALNMQLAQRSEDFNAWAASVTRMSLARLKELLEQAKNQLAAAEKSGANPKQTAEAYAKVKTLLDAITKQEAELANKDPEALKKEQWGKTLQVMNDAKQAIGNITDGFDDMDEGAKAALNAASNVAAGTIAMIMGITTLAKTGAEAIKGVERASVILAVISAALQVLQAIKGLFGNQKQLEEEAAKRREEIAANQYKQQQAYNDALFKQNMLLKESAGIFGEEAFVKAKNYYQLSIDKANEYNEAIARLNQYAIEVQRKTIAWNSILGKKTNLKEYASDLERILDTLSMVSGTEKVRSGFLGLKKKNQDVYSSLLSMYPDLITAEGKLNIERAKAIAANEELRKGDKARLEELIHIQEQAREAEEALRQHLTSTFGKVGSSLSDAITESIETGADAWDLFQKKAGDVMKEIGKMLLNEIISQRFVKDYTDKLMAVYKDPNKTPQQIALEQMQITDELMQQMGKDIPQLKEVYAQILQSAGEFAEDVSATKGVLQGVSQETATEISGRLTAFVVVASSIYEATLEANKELGTIRYSVAELRNIVLDGVEYLRKIELSTRDLGDMKSALNSIKIKINNL